MGSAKINPNTAMLVDIQYAKPDRAKNIPDCLYVIWKDLETNQKHVQTIENPSMPIYFEKDECINHKYNVDYRELEDCEKKIVKYSEIPFEIAKRMGDSGKQFLQNIFETKNYKELRMLNMYPYVFGHDFDIRTVYRYNWIKTANKNIIPKFKKGFLDIECDSFDISGFPSAQNCPVDLVTVIDGLDRVVYTFALVGREYKENPTMKFAAGKSPDIAEVVKKKEDYRKEMYDSRHEQEEYLMNHLDELDTELHEKFDDSYGNFDYRHYFYKDERQMLAHIFQCIHQISPDFLMIWNIGFDIPYLMERMRALGMDPAQYMCDPEFKNKQCYFKKDHTHFDIKNKNDHFECSSKTVYVDQMELYGAVRKGREELRSYTLNYVGQKELRDSKVDYSEEGDFKTFSYKNYWKYYIYNIKDVLLQLGIESVTNDCETLYADSYDNITSYEDNFKQTVVLRNVQYLTYLDMGYVPGANINQILLQKDMELHPEKYAKKNKKKPDFEGALVGNPLLINPFGKKMYGKRTNYQFEYSIDMDMKAFYPNTIWVLNIAASTMIFKITMKADQYDVRGGTIPFHGFTDVQLVKENTNSFNGDIAGEVMDNFQTGNILSTGHKFMNLPTVAEIEAFIKKGVA